MQNKYLVGISESQFGERQFKIVAASSPEEAVSRFAIEFAAKDELFSEYVHGKSVNASFAEHFWLQTKDEQSRFS